MEFKEYIHEAMKKVDYLGGTDNFRVTSFGNKYIVISHKEKSEQIKVDNVKELEDILNIIKGR